VCTRRVYVNVLVKRSAVLMRVTPEYVGESAETVFLLVRELHANTVKELPITRAVHHNSSVRFRFCLSGTVSQTICKRFGYKDMAAAS